MEQVANIVWAGLVAAALGGILLNGEKKNIHVSVDCSANGVLAHDRKWTSEALFNILDNAVKYTPADSDIQASVHCWEFYVKIDITDSGKGIAESRQGGYIRVTSAVGSGSTFSVFLPCK